MCPAVGQGALGIETRESGAGFDAVQPLNHGQTRAAVDAERAFLKALGGGCQVPIGAHASVSNGAVSIYGIVISQDGKRQISGCAQAGGALAAHLLAQGARAILDEVL